MVKILVYHCQKTLIPWTLNFSTVADECIELDLDPDHLVEDIKASLYDQTPPCLGFQHLLQSYKVLKDSELISSLKKDDNLQAACIFLLFSYDEELVLDKEGKVENDDVKWNSVIDPSFADTSLLLPRQRATVISHMIARCGLNPIYSQELEEKERQCEDEEENGDIDDMVFDHFGNEGIQILRSIRVIVFLLPILLCLGLFVTLVTGLTRYDSHTIRTCAIPVQQYMIIQAIFLCLMGFLMLNQTNQIAKTLCNGVNILGVDISLDPREKLAPHRKKTRIGLDLFFDIISNYIIPCILWLGSIAWFVLGNIWIFSSDADLCTGTIPILTYGIKTFIFTVYGSIGLAILVSSFLLSRYLISFHESFLGLSNMSLA